MAESPPPTRPSLSSASCRAFEEEQKLRKQEIVSRILKEEAQERSHRKRQRPPAKAAALRTLRDRTWSYISTFCEGKASPTAAGHSLVSRAVFPGGAEEATQPRVFPLNVP